MGRVNILGIEIDNISSDEALVEICKLIEVGKSMYIVTPNVDHIIKLQWDVEFKKVYDNAFLALADGMPLLWAAKFLRTPLKEKISGSDLCLKLCDIAAGKGYKLFFLGGRPGAAWKAVEVLRSKYPGIQIVGFYCPPFGFERDKVENEKIVRMIKDNKPDILCVGLGAPKQEKWIYRYKDQYQVPVSIGVGVSFEFIAGMVKRAPKWMQSQALNGSGG